jgi:predicted nucleic acid-binding protein
MSLAVPGASLPAKSLYDTSVYINAIRSKTYYERLLPHFARSLPTTYFRAVVAQELKAGCLTPAAHERVEAFLLPFRRTGRLITPTFADWEETGALLARLRQERSDLKEKLPSLINDILVVLCGRRLGAVVHTANKKNFALVQHYKDFRFEVI